MKKCPFCAEEIQDEAIICRYCGSEIKAQHWRYVTCIHHFRNPDESAWMLADDEPLALIRQHLFYELYEMITELDRQNSDRGWEIAEPRSPACIQVEFKRNIAQTILTILSAFGSEGASKSNSIWKAWVRTCTLQYKRLAEESKHETWNYWINDEAKRWERIEYDPSTKKYYHWRRPNDYNADDPNDDRWDKIPL